MKRFIYFLLLLLPFGSIAQSKDTRMVLGNARLLQSTVFGTKDSATLQKLFGTTLAYVHSGGKVETREQALHNIVHNKSTYTIDSIGEYSFSTSGDSAIVNHQFIGKEKKADGSVTDLALNIETVWLKEKKTWKLYRRKATKLKH